MKYTVKTMFNKDRIELETLFHNEFDEVENIRDKITKQIIDLQEQWLEKPQSSWAGRRQNRRKSQ